MFSQVPSSSPPPPSCSFSPELLGEDDDCGYHSSLLSSLIVGCRSVDDFSRLGRIAEGAYGVVYKAKDKKTGEIVALKKVKMEQDIEGFPITSLREIKILLMCKHSNVVDVKEVVIGPDHSCFIVMEYVEHDIKSLMAKMTRSFSISEVKTLMHQLLSATAYLHTSWIMHRDLKTSNLLYNNRGELKVADFGLAREYAVPLKSYTPTVVTLWYRAPELLLGEQKYTPAIDMWAIGCIFAELMSKDTLLPGRTELDQLSKMFKLLGTPNEKIWRGFSKLPNARMCKFAHEPYNNLKVKFPFISEAAFDLLNRLLTYDPTKRISAKEALEHPFFSESPLPSPYSLMPTSPVTIHAEEKAKIAEERRQQEREWRKRERDTVMVMEMDYTQDKRLRY